MPSEIPTMLHCFLRYDWGSLDVTKYFLNHVTFPSLHQVHLHRCNFWSQFFQYSPHGTPPTVNSKNASHHKWWEHVLPSICFGNYDFLPTVWSSLWQLVSFIFMNCSMLPVDSVRCLFADGQFDKIVLSTWVSILTVPSLMIKVNFHTPLMEP